MTTSRLSLQDRWQFAAERVYLKDIRIRPIAGTGNRFTATSGSEPGRQYLVTAMRDCTCAAGISGDRVCVHRAAVGLRLGLLPEAPFPAVDPDAGDITVMVMDDAGQLMEVAA